ncbi:MAG TPA: DUF72 domain-containing protein [Candidatus Limnocylindrales bacterium]|nr:DUF72 domain-containing protein [Candidatus Limnocylindrales bacterium]
MRGRPHRAGPAGEGLTPDSPGTLFAGTSGFSYADWIPRFYPAGTRSGDLLRTYAARLPAVELNATFRRRPTAGAIAGWLRATPPGFRFAVKAQRGSAVRALASDPAESIAWLTEPLPSFGERLGVVLFRVPAEIRRGGPIFDHDPAVSDGRLRAMLDAWPRDIPLVVELQDPSWHVDETFAALRAAGATLCATELPEHDEPPTIRRTGSFLYLRLRREDYTSRDVVAWAARIRPFLDAGDDVFAFFRHDADGRAGELALELVEAAGG